jgi:hypothetical protein
VSESWDDDEPVELDDDEIELDLDDDVWSADGGGDDDGDDF